MKEVADLIKQCRDLQVSLIPVGDKLKMKGPRPLPDELIVALKEVKNDVMAELRKQLPLEAECWVLKEWRRTSLPAWRRILKESIRDNDTGREEYARWMLREVLEDPNYQED